MASTPGVLLLSTDDDEGVSAIRDALTLGGFLVHGCGGSFPCDGLRDAGCPLDRGDVALAIDVRQHPWPQPTAREAGVRCALRAGIPVVVTGRTLRHPFEGWVTAVELAL